MVLLVVMVVSRGLTWFAFILCCVAFCLILFHVLCYYFGFIWVAMSG